MNSKKHQKKPKTTGGVIKVNFSKNELLFKNSIKEKIMHKYNIRNEADLSEIQFAIAHISNEANIEGILYELKELDFPVFGIVGNFSFENTIGMVFSLFDYELVEDFDFQLIDNSQESLNREIVSVQEAKEFSQHINLGFSFMESEKNSFRIVFEGKIYKDKMISIVLNSHSGKTIFY